MVHQENTYLCVVLAVLGLILLGGGGAEETQVHEMDKTEVDTKEPLPLNAQLASTAEKRSYDDGFIGGLDRLFSMFLPPSPMALPPIDLEEEAVEKRGRGPRNPYSWMVASSSDKRAPGPHPRNPYSWLLSQDGQQKAKRYGFHTSAFYLPPFRYAKRGDHPRNPYSWQLNL